MDFSIFYELQTAEPTASSEPRLFHEAVEQATLADELGYRAVWAVEHHGLREYAHSSAPEVFLAFVAARTRRIRLGHGVTLLPYRYNHPIRIAERIATLDILSGGRVDWGTGKSSSAVEQGAFQVNPADLDAEWREAIEMIPRMWKDEVFSFRGRFFDIPPTQIVPKPVQTPHPPIYAACSMPESAVTAGGLGLGALNFALGNDDELAEKVRAYRRAVGEACPAGRAKTNRFACTPATLVLDDDREACRHGLRGMRFFLSALFAYYMSGTRPIGALAVPREPLSEAEIDEAIRDRDAQSTATGAIIGDPVRAREIVSRFARAGVDELILVMQMGTVPHEVVMRSLRIFAEKVMPFFR